jgi:putative transposase
MFNWPHAPVHRLSEQGAYMVTAGTYLKRHHLTTSSRMDLVLSRLFDYADEFGWRLQAWAVLSNHYHFVASSPEDPGSLRQFLSKLHTKTSIELNRMDKTPGRRVWYQYWDSHITYPTSYYARLKYVHQNPVHHGVHARAENYPWCSASWFAQTAQRSFVQTINSFKLDKVNVLDEFQVIAPVMESGV